MRTIPEMIPGNANKDYSPGYKSPGAYDHIMNDMDDKGDDACYEDENVIYDQEILVMAIICNRISSNFESGAKRMQLIKPNRCQLPIFGNSCSFTGSLLSPHLM